MYEDGDIYDTSFNPADWTVYWRQNCSENVRFFQSSHFRCFLATNIVTRLTRQFSFLSLRRPQLLATPRSVESPVTSHPTSTTLTTPNPAVLSLQVRNHRRATYKPSHRVRKRRHGFLSRVKTRTGRAMLKRRRAKGRHRLSH